MSEDNCPYCQKSLSIHSMEDHIDCIVGIVNRLDESFKKLPHLRRN